VGAMGAIAAGQSTASATPEEKAQAPATGTPPQAVPGTPSSAEASEEMTNALVANASNWWGVLQDQFNRVAGAAMTGSGLNNLAGEDASASKPAKRSKAVSASKVTKSARSGGSVVKSSAPRASTTVRKTAAKKPKS